MLLAIDDMFFMTNDDKKPGPLLQGSLQEPMMGLRN